MRDLKQFNVLVTPKSYGAIDATLKSDLEDQVGKVVYNDRVRPLKEQELIELIPDMDGIIAGLDPITKDVIGAAARLKVISRYGVGVDRVDLQVATAQGILVTNTPGANSASVAELTVGLILSLLRKICELNNLTKSGKWVFLHTTSLKNKRVGLIGFGAIGKETAKRLQAFDCSISVYDPYINSADCHDFNVRLRDLPTLLGESDVVSLHLPATPETANFVNQAFFSQLKRGACLINTARGELIDHDALLQALQSGHLAGLALDAYAQEPPDFQDPVFAFDQVIATPHCGAHSDDAINSMGRVALENCLAVLRGQIPGHVVNPELLYENPDYQINERKNKK